MTARQRERRPTHSLHLAGNGKEQETVTRGQPYDPVPATTTAMVRRIILKSSQTLQLSM